jgi:hypothetical protein
MDIMAMVLKEGKMPRILLGLIFATVLALPAPAPDYHKNFRACAKELSAADGCLAGVGD